MIITLLILITLCPCAWGASFFTNYNTMSPQQQIASLQAEQIDHPYDPVINYNLGVALYRNNKFKEAQENFSRAYKHSNDAVELKKLCLFNHANSTYKYVLSTLPDNWEDKKVDIKADVLEFLITETKQAIASYNQILETHKNDAPAIKNKASAEILLKKLENKKQQQQQRNEKQQDQQRDQQKQQNENNQHEDTKDNLDKKSSQNKEKNTSKNRKQQKDLRNENHNEQGQDNASTPEDDKKKDKRQGENDQKEPNRNKRPDDSHQKGSDGEDEKLNHNQSKKNKQSDINKSHQTPKSDSLSQEKIREHPSVDSMQYDKEKQGSGGESSEMRALRAILENLQADESKMQKQKMRDAVGTTKTPIKPGQKPW